MGDGIDAVIDVFATCFQSVYVENYPSDAVYKYLFLSLCVCVCVCVGGSGGLSLPLLVDSLPFTCI